jgi:hypothetical protein
MAYYFDHQAAIGKEIHQELAEVDQLRAAAGPSPLAARFRAKGWL